MDEVTYAFATAALAPARGLLVDIGARDINGCMRAAAPSDATYVGVDVLPGRNVDVLASGAALPFVVVAWAVCLSVFEHTPDGEAICREVYRRLAPGGTFVVSTVNAQWPPHSAIDGLSLRPGEYYGGVDGEEMARWLSDFHHVDLRVSRRGDVFAVATKEAIRSS